MNLRETQAAETREKLFISARSLFAKKGYKGTSVREINRSVGLADGLLYHYFPGGKADIFRNVLEEESSRIIASFPAEEKLAVYKEMPVSVMLSEIYRDFSDIIRENLDIIRILFREAEALNTVTDRDSSCMFYETPRWFTDLLKEKHARGEVRSMDFESASDIYTGILFSRVLELVFDNRDEMICGSKTRLFDHLADLWKA